MRGLIPYVLLGPNIKVEWEIQRDWQAEKSEEIPKLYLDHIASVNDFKAWKAEHPKDGTMLVMFKWAPYLIVTASAATFNFMGVAMGAALILQKRRQRR
jgi:hypothetical protein